MLIAVLAAAFIGERMTVDRVRVLEADRNAWLEVTLHEGRKHEVKRLLESVGHPVSKLRRVALGPVTMRGLDPGEFRSLSPSEVQGFLRGLGPRKEALSRSPRPRPFGRRPGRPSNPSRSSRPRPR